MAMDCSLGLLQGELLTEHAMYDAQRHRHGEPARCDLVSEALELSRASLPSLLDAGRLDASGYECIRIQGAVSG
ncbi:hypothetical protein KGM_213179 [Danaus plexippus plexippus]|uniref:Uncharacterized protein n=1 Tax=Danaus plexippus plexippus TaxID=278856 RepID=A0A212FAW9_DANPL|nr:hypothetical protein KGM_213179 [Danaus plexippus plexippus]